MKSIRRIGNKTQYGIWTDTRKHVKSRSKVTMVLHGTTETALHEIVKAKEGFSWRETAMAAHGRGYYATDKYKIASAYAQQSKDECRNTVVAVL